MSILLSVLSVPEYETYEEVKSYAKIYPNSTKLIIYDKPVRVRKAGFEPHFKEPKLKKNPSSNPMLIIDSLRRSKTRIADLVTCNQFDLWCTFTFNCSSCPPNKNGKKCTNDGGEGCVCDEETCKRFDINFCKKRMSRWLKNQYRFTGEFKYLIVPEFHKDHKAIHFHAFFKGYKGELIETNKFTKRGQRKYNFAYYPYGWSDAVYIGQTPEDIAKAANYIRKYIQKDMPQFLGKKRYWVSHKLIRPKKIRNPIVFPYQMNDNWTEYKNKTTTFKMIDKKIDFVAQQEVDSKREGDV